MARVNDDISVICQIMPGIPCATPAGSSDIAVLTQAAYEIGTTPITNVSVPASDLVDDWWYWDYGYEGEGGDAADKAIIEEVAVSWGSPTWDATFRFNKRAGGHLWGVVLDHGADPELVPLGTDILVHRDGYGAGGQGATFLHPFPAPADISHLANPTQGGSALSADRPGSDARNANAEQEASSKGPRWSQASPCVSFQVTDLGNGRKDVLVQTVPLDFAPMGQEARTRALNGSPLCPDIWVSMVLESMVRLNWPAPGIHTGFDRWLSRDGNAALASAACRKSMLSCSWWDTFDDLYVFDGADGDNTFTKINETTLHAAFDSAQFGTNGHLHTPNPNTSTATWLYFVADTTNWPAGYAKIGVEVRVNIADIGRSAAAVTAGFPEIANANDLSGRVDAFVEGTFAVVRVNVPGVDTTGKEYNVPAGAWYENGTLTVRAVDACEDANLTESLGLFGTVVRKSAGAPYSGDITIPSALVTDTEKRAGLMVVATGANVRAADGYGAGAGFAIGVAGKLIAGYLGPLDETQFFNELRFARNSATDGGGNAGTPRAYAVTHLSFEMIQNPGLDGVPSAFMDDEGAGRTHVNCFKTYPCYWMVGSQAEVQASMEWLATNGWLALPLPHTKYHSVP